MRRQVIPILLVGVLGAAACSSGDESGTASTAVATTTTPPDTTAPAIVATTTPATTPATGPPTTASPATTAPTEQSADAMLLAAIEADLAAAPEGCDPLDPRQCVLPFPSNATAVDDATSATGLRVALPADGLPANADGVHIDPTEWNRNDGFSANSSILTHVADLDAGGSGLPSWTDLEASLGADSPVVIIDADGNRIPLWAEPSHEPSSDADTLLVIHPAVSLTGGTTYHVALRGLVTTGGAPVEPSAAFRSYRDRLITEINAIEDRRAEMEAMFADLDAAGMDRADLQLAWTFTVASTENITERMLHIRDVTLGELGDAAPQYTITSVSDAPEQEGIARQVTGTYTVTNWLTGDGSPGNQYNTGPDGLPAANGTLEAPFICNISDTTMSGTEPAHLVSYGHGLLGRETEINAGNVRAMSNEHNAVYCATKWAGMSADDVDNAITVLGDLSGFATMADRLQQGVLNHLVLGRLMLAADGLAADPAFQRTDGTSLVDNSVLYYDGNSQGGIMGLMLAGVSTDFERAVLGVPGMNYSLLLPRSVDFDTYESVMEPAYPSTLDRMVAISALQMLWDRGEGAGYVQHIIDDPLPGTPVKQVLMHVAYGDHQVSVLSALVQARTMGVPIHRPIAREGRFPGDPAWGLGDAIPGESTSAIVIWDSGMAPMPFEATPPREGDDSHEDPRADIDARRQKAAFLFDGEFIDVCGGEACLADHVS